MKYNSTIVKYLFAVACCIGISAAQAQTYVMGTSGNATTCSGIFTDSGNETGNYGNNQTQKITFCSATPDSAMYVQFLSFRTEATYDILTVYNGPTTASPVLGTYSGTTSPGTIVSSNPSNCLTFLFSSDASTVYAGWIANVGCGTPPPPPPPATNTTCAASSAFCSSNNYNFPAATGTVAEPGPDYDCLLTQPNPVWYYLQISQSGNLDIAMSNTSNLDVDFVCWGPFNSSNVCAQLPTANVADCSYSANATEQINIAGAVAGQYYILCVTNYSNQPTNFILTTSSSSTATTNCAILCDITNMTANVTACSGNTHTVSGVLTVQYPPANDTLTISSSTGQDTIITGTFGTSVPYSISGISNSGGPFSVTAQFGSDPSCNFTRTYNLPVVSITPTIQNAQCFGTSTGSISVTSTATPAVTYTWSNSLPAGNTVSNLPVGSYTVTATGSNGCSASGTYSITQPTAVVLGIPVITQSTCTVGGSITANASGGTGTKTFTWSTGANTATITGLAAASYSVTATDASGCTASATYVVPAAPGSISLSSAITDATCTGSATGDIAVGATGGTGTITLNWSNGQTGPFIGNLAAGTYSVTATDANGCSAVGSFVVGEQTQLAFDTAIVRAQTCTGLGSITVNATGGTGTFTYNWSNGQTGATISNLTPGNYTVTATGSAGCSVTASYVVLDSIAIISVSDTTITPVSCAGGNSGTITIVAAGGTAPYTYLWNTTDNTATITGLPAGPYTVTVTDANGCSTVETYDVPNGLPLTVSISASQIICTGSTNGQATANITSGGTAPFTYQWNNGASTPTINNLPAGLVQVTVTDANSCSGTALYVIQQTQFPVQASVFDYPNLCDNPPYVRLDIRPEYVVGPTFIEVVGVGDTTVVNNDALFNATGSFTIVSPTGTYTINVTDSLGCTYTRNYVVVPSGPGTFETDSVPASCFGAADGEISIHALAGAAPFTYSFNGGAFGTDSVFTGLAAGSYTITAKSNNGCTVAITGTVTQPAQLIANATPDTILTVPGTPNAVNVTVTGFTNPVYAWEPLANSSCAACNNPNLTVNETMAVYVTVSEASNSSCFAIDSVVIIVGGEVKMPSAFSPNGDSNNDVFRVVPAPSTRMLELRVYNRWGALVYKGTDGWDGTANGKEQAPGTFIYYAQVETPDKDNPGKMKIVSTQGEVVLVR